MPRKGYSAVVIPTVLYDKLKAFVEASEGRYVSLSEVVREAVWKFLNEAK